MYVLLWLIQLYDSGCEAVLLCGFLITHSQGRSAAAAAAVLALAGCCLLINAQCHHHCPCKPQCSMQLQLLLSVAVLAGWLALLCSASAGRRAV